MKGQKCPCQCHDVILSGNHPVTPSCSVHNTKTPSSKTYLMSSNSKPVLRSCHLHPIIPLGRHSQAPCARDFWGAYSSLSLSHGTGTASPSTVQCHKSVSRCKLWRESKENHRDPSELHDKSVSPLQPWTPSLLSWEWDYMCACIQNLKIVSYATDSSRTVLWNALLTRVNLKLHRRCWVVVEHLFPVARYKASSMN